MNFKLSLIAVIVFLTTSAFSQKFVLEGNKSLGKANEYVNVSDDLYVWAPVKTKKSDYSIGFVGEPEVHELTFPKGSDVNSSNEKRIILTGILLETEDVSGFEKYIGWSVEAYWFDGKGYIQFKQ